MFSTASGSRHFHTLSAFVEIYQAANHAILRKFQTPKNLSVEVFQIFSCLSNMGLSVAAQAVNLQ